jgi:Kef-type K+ transport system membrane component KefB/nucleotide-binding universal stress UspA family protein
MNAILALSLLLAAGFGTAQLAKLARLPSVTGYIAAGIALGPAGLNLIPHDLLRGQLRTFTEIALMLVAFGIGESLDLQQLGRGARTLLRVTLGESLGAFLLVVGGTLAAVLASGAFGAATTWRPVLAVSLLAGAIAIATAPASTIAVVREGGYRGPLSRLLLSDVALNNALSVTVFGLATATAHLLLRPGVTGAGQVGAPIIVTLGSLLIGVGVGLMADWAIHRLTRRSDILIAALGAIFFAGGMAGILGLSPMLAGLAVGFTIVNRDRRDVRAFRALADFEPPIFGVFFALAGAELDLPGLITGGLVGVVFVLTRAAGKVAGAWVGAKLSDLDEPVWRRAGLGLLSQAGLAIGLAYLVEQDPSLAEIRSVLVSMVVASVVVNELIGPPLLRMVLGSVEDGMPEERRAAAPGPPRAATIKRWEGGRLERPDPPRGTVVYGMNHLRTVRPLTRLAVLLANHYRALPVGVHVLAEDDYNFWNGSANGAAGALFRIARSEAEDMGYPLITTVEYAATPAEGLARAGGAEAARALLLGHPLQSTTQSFRRVVESAARAVSCPVIVAKLTGLMETSRVLAPVTGAADLRAVEPVVLAITRAEGQRASVLWLLPATAAEAEIQAARAEFDAWLQEVGAASNIEFLPAPAESRLATVIEAIGEHDLTIVSVTPSRGLQRLFFGSLAEDIAARSTKPLIMIWQGSPVGERARPAPGPAAPDQ